MFAFRTWYGFPDCTDGTSNTVAFGEIMIGDNTAATRNGAEYYNCVPWPSGTAGGSGADMVMPNTTAVGYLNKYIVSCNAARTSNTSEVQSRGYLWAAGRMADGPLTSMLTTPNNTGADCIYVNEDGMVAMRSRHPGGVNTLMTDGSVKFIKNSISQVTWWALGTKAGGEVIDQSSY
jgi:prepilin-type processing-associated H-X9-DG protein